MRKRLRALALFVGLSAPAGAATLVVSPGGAVPSLAAALERARAGDVVEVVGGVHPGPVVVERSIRLVGRGRPVIDGGGRGTVVSLRAPGIGFEGFVVRASGDSLDQENSGIALEAPGGRIVDNRLEEVLFGIYLRKAAGSLVEGNHVRGKALDLPRRGDAVRIWYSDDVRLEGNRVAGSRDVVLWYSSRLAVRGNRVGEGRYGLHFMYCDDATIEGNLLAGNSVGAFLMYSRRLHLEGNTIVGNHGPSGYGVGLKDMDDAVVARNLFAGNRVGAFLDNSPRERSSESRFEGNLFAGNDVGVVLMPNVARGRFLGNSFVDNQQSVGLAGGGGDPEANRWLGNHWSEYAGYDADGDGVGDVPMRAEELFEALADRRPELRLFAMSPLTEAIAFAARAFPLVRPRPRLVDPAPRMAPHRPPGVPPLPQGGDPALVGLGGGLALGGLLLLLSPRLARLAGRGARGRSAKEGRMVKETTPGGRPLVEARGLRQRYGQHLALDGVSFRLGAGEAVALWGPNGAGKTTALKAILGLLPAKGELSVGGLDPRRRGKQARALIGFVPQEVCLQADVSVAETLDFHARLRRAPRGRARQLLAELGLAADAGRRVGELSGGQRQRLALAIALVADPPLLLLDEPTANLDAAARRAFLELLGTWVARGKTLLFSSHRPEEVRALAGRVLHLEQGRLVADAPPSEVRLEPAGDAHLWLRFAEGQIGAAVATLAAAGFSPRRLGSHLVLSVDAEHKVDPISLLCESHVELLDFELDAGGGARGGGGHA